MNNRIAHLAAGLVSVLLLLASCKDVSWSGPAAPVNPVASDTKVKEAVNLFNLTGFPIVNAPIVLSAMGAKAVSHGEWKDMEVLKQYAKKTNMTIHWQTEPDNLFREKRNIALAGSNLPDFLYRAKLSPFDMVNFGSRGILIPLNELIERYAPNLRTMFANYPNVKKSITAPDGNIYALPQVAEYLAPLVGNKPWINKRWLDRLHLPIPSTTEQFYETLKAFKGIDFNGNGIADEVVWSGEKGFSLWESLAGAWGLALTGFKNGNVDVGPDGNIRFYTMEPQYKSLLEYLHNMYRDGLIDKEVFTQDSPQLQSKLTQGLVGATNMTNTYKAGDNYRNDYVSMPALQGPNGNRLYTAVSPVTQTQGTFAITKNNKHPEATIRWIDYFYGEEGSKFLRMGIEGETYTTLADGSVHYTDRIAHNLEGLSLEQMIGRYSPWPGGSLPHLITEKYDRTGNSMPSALASAKLLEPDIPREILPSFLFTKEEQDRLNMLSGVISTYVVEMRVKFVTGAVPLTEYDNYVGTLKSMGSDEYTGIYQAAYNRYKNN
ncbi:extracellular solute-binding protein [Paenibacillus sp. NPDC056579]|uniref:extracellular solute-binding protein n=1 Tax=Paenibacillus sp. NPDC056579 TaxID=3345871 RepID=UPI00369785AA